jgi:hypothetical protein
MLRIISIDQCEKGFPFAKGFSQLPDRTGLGHRATNAAAKGFALIWNRQFANGLALAAARAGYESR